MSPIPTRANDLSFIFNTLFIVSLKRSGFLAKVVFLHVKGCGFGDIQLIHFLKKKKKKARKKAHFLSKYLPRNFYSCGNLVLHKQTIAEVAIALSSHLMNINLL